MKLLKGDNSTFFHYFLEYCRGSAETILCSLYQQIYSLSTLLCVSLSVLFYQRRVEALYVLLENININCIVLPGISHETLGIVNCAEYCICFVTALSFLSKTGGSMLARSESRYNKTMVTLFTHFSSFQNRGFCIIHFNGA